MRPFCPTHKVLGIIYIFASSNIVLEKWTQAMSSLMIGFIFIIIGLPLWWHTTKVYRASLPYQDIEMLTQLKVV
jgi:hypothetical protein